MQEDSWARPPGGYRDPTEMQAWMDRRRLDKDGLTVALAALCEAVMRDLDADLAIHREHVLPTPITLPVRLDSSIMHEEHFGCRDTSG